MMRIIFLDIDGVVNRWDGSPRTTRVHTTPEQINHLHTIIARTNALLVVTSYHREFSDDDGWRALIGDGLIDQTDFHPDPLPVGDKNAAINHWLSTHEVDGYVILDDTPDLSHVHASHLVHVRSPVGLQPTDVDRAVTILQQII